MSSYSVWHDHVMHYLNYQVQCAQVITRELDRNHKRKLSSAINSAIRKSRKTDKHATVSYELPNKIQQECTKFFLIQLPSFRLENLDYYNTFRMSAKKMEELMLIVGSEMSKQNSHEDGIPFTNKLALTLRFLASGDSTSSLCGHYSIDVAEANKIIPQTCAILWNELHPKVLPEKLTTEQWLEIAQNFEEKYNIPHCLGAIDVKHVIVKCPDDDQSTYQDQNIVLLLMCDTNYIITLADVGIYGRRSTGEIFRDSNLGSKLEKNELNFPDAAPVNNETDPLPYCVIGDEAFPLKTNLLRPYPVKQKMSAPKQEFNKLLSKVTRIVENTLGVLVDKWLVYRKSILTTEIDAIKIVKATLVLHNWLCRDDSQSDQKVQYITKNLIDRTSSDGSVINGTWRVNEGHGKLKDICRISTNNSTRSAIQLRDQFCSYLFQEETDD